MIKDLQSVSVTYHGRKVGTVPSMRCNRWPVDAGSKSSRKSEKAYGMFSFFSFICLALSTIFLKFATERDDVEPVGILSINGLINKQNQYHHEEDLFPVPFGAPANGGKCRYRRD